MKFPKLLFPALLIVLMLGACATPNRIASVGFTACDDQGLHENLSDSLCQYIDAPLDHGTRQGDLIKLFARKFPARAVHQGEIWLVAGGPGESGASFYADIDFFRQTFPNHDVIVPDHRGTGFAAKLCMPEETSESPDGLALAGEEWGSCFEKLYSDPGRANNFSQRNAAYDLDRLIATVGSDKQTLIYGVSYGTSLVLEYTKVATTNVDAIILDSLIPAASDTLHSLYYRSHMTDRVGQELLQRCAADNRCSLGKDATRTYHALLKDIDDGANIEGMEQVPNGNLRQFLGLLLDVPAARNRIPDIINALSRRDPAARQLIGNVISHTESFWAKITQFQQATSSIPLSAVISGSEASPGSDLTAKDLVEENAALGFTSPLPGLLLNSQFPLYEKPEALPTPAKTPPILVLQGTLDPKTPYDAALEHAAKLRANGPVAILTLTDAPHAAYITSQDCLSIALSLFAQDPSEFVSRTCDPTGVSVVFRMGCSGRLMRMKQSP